MLCGQRQQMSFTRGNPFAKEEDKTFSEVATSKFFPGPIPTLSWQMIDLWEAWKSCILQITKSI